MASGADYSRYTRTAAWAAMDVEKRMADDEGDQRFETLRRWVQNELRMPAARIEPASADASFRRYFRVYGHGRGQAQPTFIVMDAPPNKENLQPFLHVAQLLRTAQINVPQVLASDTARGLLLLSDLGSQLYLPALTDSRRADDLYRDALSTLLRMQSGIDPRVAGLPAYDAPRLQAEMELMPEWFLRRHLGVALNAEMQGVLQKIFEQLIASALEQPQVFVHRDFHSRNLLVCAPCAPGVLDFQDAVIGPVTYDLVSLLKDCYIAWPEERVRSWALEFRRRALDERGASAAGAGENVFLRWFDWMGLQRHLKVLGIFARLWYRDGKRGYLNDLPLVFDYALDAAKRYSELKPLRRLLVELEPAFRAAQAREGAAIERA